MELRDTGVHKRARGRPEATSRAEIERVAFELFSAQGFEKTTMDGIAARVGVGRRTLFRYYPSKNDIAWGEFDLTLARLHELLYREPWEKPLCECVQSAVIEFNSFPDDAFPSHRERMRLLLGIPELQAHSALRYAAWRRVISDFVAERMDVSGDDLVPQSVGHASLGLSLAAYEFWLNLAAGSSQEDNASLRRTLERAMRGLRAYLMG